MILNYLSDLLDAERPGILVGGGAFKARDMIVRFAESLNIPVFRTWNALDVITDDSPVYGGTVGTYGGPGRNFGVQNTDLLLALGCRFSGRITGGSPETFAREAKRYTIDIEHGDSAEVFMRSMVSYPDLDFIDWLRACRIWVEKYDCVTPEHLETWHHYGFMRRLSQMLPADAIVVSDTGGNQIMMGHCFQSKRGQRIFSSNGNTPMGFAMCGAIGAWFAEPERPVICIIGDGGMQLNIQELQTIRHYRIPLKVFIINNRVLGNTKAYQRVNKRPEIACGPDGYSAPCFQAIATAYGLKANTLSEWSRFEYVVSSALQAEHAVVVDVVDDDRCQYEPRISRFDLPIEDMQPFLPRDEFRSNLYIQPVPGWENNK